MSSIVLFGEVLADIFPDKTVLGGAPYNVARHLRALQQHPTLITRVGNDVLKDQLLADMSRRDMAATGVQLDQTHPTGQVTVHIENNAHRFEICSGQAYDYIDAESAANVSFAAQPSIIYFGSLIQRNSTSQTALAKCLNSTSCTRFLDINLRAPWYDKATVHSALQNANIVKVSEEELAVIVQLLELESHTATKHALSLTQTYQLTALFVTCGEHGAWTVLPSGEKLETKNQTLGTKEVVDTVGAGDAFSAICILGYLHHWPLTLTLERANDFAIASCQIRGAASESNDFYLPFLKWLKA